MSRRVAMGIVGLDHVQVASPRGCETEARRFYGTLLGLEEIDKPPELRARGGVWFRCGNQQLHIGVEDGFAPAQKAHLFLAKALTERFPETNPLIVHRVYTLDRDRARELFGAEIAEIVPEHGLVDVHRYVTIALEDQRFEIDATFPGPAWDGHSALPLACGPGQDYPAREEPDAEKRTLEERYCDPAVREPFIAALARRRC